MKLTILRDTKCMPGCYRVLDLGDCLLPRARQKMITVS